MHTRFISTLVFIVFTLFVSSVSWAQPNILLIISDDLNNALGAYGHPLAKTPNLDQLAAEGLNFNRAYNQFPLCGPSRASMLTGLYPDQNGMKELRGDFRKTVPNAVTLPQYFMNYGYQVARVGKVYHQNNPNGIGKEEFDDEASWQERYNPKGIETEFDDINCLSKVDGVVQWTKRNQNKTGATLSWLDADGLTPNGQLRNDPLLYTDGKVATQAIELIDRYTQRDKPFFLAVGFYKPHTPYIAPKQFFDLYDIDSIEVPVTPKNYFDTLPEGEVKTLTKKPQENNLDPKMAREAIRGYLATVSFMDSQVGRLAAALDDPNGDGDKSDSIRDNTIVVFVSDHGYHLGEHDHYQKMTLFDNAARNPLIISVPGMETRGQMTNSLVELVDLYPTLTDLAGLEKPESVAGISLAPMMQHADAILRTSALTQLNHGYTIRTEEYRYTCFGKGGSDEIELYDLKSDPEEMNNLAYSDSDSYAPVIKTMDSLLIERINDARKMP